MSKRDTAILICGVLIALVFVLIFALICYKLFKRWAPQWTSIPRFADSASDWETLGDEGSDTSRGRTGNKSKGNFHAVNMTEQKIRMDNISIVSINDDVINLDYESDEENGHVIIGNDDIGGGWNQISSNDNTTASPLIEQS